VFSCFSLEVRTEYIAGSAAAQALPGGKANAVGNEMYRAVGQDDVHSPGVVTAGDNVVVDDGGVAARCRGLPIWLRRENPSRLTEDYNKLRFAACQGDFIGKIGKFSVTSWAGMAGRVIVREGTCLPSRCVAQEEITSTASLLYAG
jgi:hypothetical protein